MTNTKTYITVLFIVIIAEAIGKLSFAVHGATITLLPLLYAVIIGMLITPDLLGKVITPLQKVISMKEVKFASSAVGLALLPLGVRYGTLVGPHIVDIIKAGPALILQEIGNLATIVIALPLAMLLGMKREAFGATVSICREPTLGVISDRYGINSPEGTGVLGTYLMGTVFGTIYFSFLGSIGTMTGLHPYSLAMASGMGSASMMTAATASLSATVPVAMKSDIIAYAATSNMLTGITGIYSVVFLAIPIANWYYKKISQLKGDQ